MMAHYDAAVLGLGAVGSATALQLARYGAKVIGFDRFGPPHALGSTHGETRVTRLAIGEGEHLTPLAIRSHELWREVEAETGTALLSETGLLIISSDCNAAQTHVSGFFDRTVAAAKKFGIVHELLDGADIRARWPRFRVRKDERGYFEPAAGFVRPEDCVRAHLMLARRHGAVLHANETVIDFEGSAGHVTITTDKGRYSADTLVVAAGAWLPQLLGLKYASLFKVYRQTQVWFEVDDPIAFAPANFPVFIWELPDSTRGLYGFPALAGDRVIKVASEEFSATTTPEHANRSVSAEEIVAVRQLALPHLQGVGPQCNRATACLYTVTPDFGFVLDRHPECERIIIASACSGHGFKHSPALGEVLADMALGRQMRFDLAPFRLDRFSCARA